MKKTIILTVALVFAVAVGSAFAESKADQKAGPALYNGITYFDLGKASLEKAPIMTAQIEPVSKPFNGVTYFDLGQPKAVKNYVEGSAAGGLQGKAPAEKKPFNGITLF